MYIAFLGGVTESSYVYSPASNSWYSYHSLWSIWNYRPVPPWLALKVDLFGLNISVINTGSKVFEYVAPSPARKQICVFLFGKNKIDILI